MLVSGRYVEAVHLLPLILVRLVVCVGNLKPVARREQIQMECIVRAALIVDAIEERFIVANVVHRVKLGAVQEAP